MVYDYAVKVNGEYYPAGTDVPDNTEEVQENYFTDLETELETEPVKRGRPRKTN